MLTNDLDSRRKQMLYLMNNVEEIKEMKRFDWSIVKLAILREALIREVLK